MATGSTYNPLEPSSRQIRLLHLLPLRAAGFGPAEPWHHCIRLECTLETVTMDNVKAYEALSYMWSDSDPTVNILLDGKKVLIRPNLAYALAALRTSKPRVLWIDALCINQENFYERNHQVRLMGEIFDRASQVLVWLGRPGSRWDSSVAGALRLAERLSNHPPVSRLPPPPPEPNASHEHIFDQWLESLNTNKAVKKDGKVQTKSRDPLTDQHDRWTKMKTRRDRQELERQRLPEMMEDLQKADQLLTQMRRELRKLKDRESQQRDALKELRLLESHQQRRLREPQRRLVQDFRDSQRQVFREVSSTRPGDLLQPTTVQQHQSRDVREQKGHRAQSLQKLEEVDRLWLEVLEELGDFQRSTYDLRQSIDADAGMELPLREKWESYLGRLKQVDENQRRGLWAVQYRVRRWQRLENKEHQIAMELWQTQDLAFRARVGGWMSSQAVEVQNMGNFQNFMSAQCDQLQALRKQQQQELQSLQARQEKLWTVDPERDAKADPILTHEELKSLAEVKRHRRMVLRQLLVVLDTELSRREIDAIIEQCHSWKGKVRQMAKEVPSEAESLSDSVAAQAGWVQYWLDMRERERMEWESLLFDQLNIPKEFPNIDLLSLESICRLPYWHRLWIVQEVLLAKELVLCFGDNAKTTRSWDVLTKARCSLDAIPNHWVFKPAISAPITKIKHTFPFQLDRLRNGDRRSWPLHSLIDITENSLCRDPRDKLYGLLGLADDVQAGDFDISYQNPLEMVYQDAIHWYHSKNGAEEGRPSLVRFSQILQLSLKGHHDPQSSGNYPAPLPLNDTVLSRSAEKFCVEAVSVGPVLPIEKCVDNRDLMALRQRDWISTLLDYLEDSALQKPRPDVEDELVYLDSISTTLSMPNSTSTYAVEEADGVDKIVAPQLFPVNSQQAKRQDSQFFVTEKGEFGISLACIREDDVLCEFQDSHLGIIVRRREHRYEFVSKAIMASIATDRKTRSLRLNSALDRSTGRLIERDQIEGVWPGRAANNPAIHVMFDAASLQQLSMPLSLSPKHEYRETLCIQEASFGWHDFTTLGLDTSLDSYRLALGKNEIVRMPPFAPADEPNGTGETTVMTDVRLSASDWISSADDVWKHLPHKLFVNLEADVAGPSFDISQMESTELLSMNGLFEALMLSDSNQHITSTVAVTA
jgi:hypothetical protein